jgi:aspartyl-tRNA(Asn)/glutamyl-tRNA(Gln) amidotransferase subunit C
MQLKSEDLEKLGRLARLAMTDSERQTMLPDLKSVLDWVSALSEAPTTDVPPMAHPHDLGLRLREDVPQPLPDRASLMANAPEQAEGLFLVPRVLE